MKKLLLFTILAGSISTVYGQSSFSEFADVPSAFTISSGNNTLQVGGRVSFYYENRLLKGGQDNLKHNGFDVKDADIDILGKTANKFSYEFQYSLVDIITAASTQNPNIVPTLAQNTYNPTNPGFKAVYVRYDGFKIKIKLGYDKLPFSQSNLNHEHETPFWGHPNLTGGDLFSRRDIGLSLSTHFLKNRIRLFAGAYSGLGENYFQYGNDESGTFEYVARAEFSYPSKMNYNEIDEENSPILHFRVAGNVRYEDKTQPGTATVATLYPDAPGSYNTRMITGRRTIYGGDAMVKYRGISATFEADILSLKPKINDDILYASTPASFNKGVINAGGFVTTFNYNWEKAHSVFSVRYENFDTNDLIAGNQGWLGFAYAYKVSSFNSVAKIEYLRPTTEDDNQNALKYFGQVRVGYQIVF